MGRKAAVVDWGENPVPVGCNRAAALVAHIHPVPAVHTPSVGCTVFVPAYPLGTFEDQVAHNPGLDIQDPAGHPEALGGVAVNMGCQIHMAVLSSFLSDP